MSPFINVFRKLSTANPAWFILAFTLLPLFGLCVYNVPIGDDLWYADAFRTHGLIGTQQLWYQQWSGRYMATLLISTVNPVSYGYFNLAFLHPLILLLATAASMRFLLNTVINQFNFDVNKWLVLSVFLFFYLNYVPDLGESFYWMAGAYTYQLPVIFLFLYLGIILRLLRSDSVPTKVLYSVLAAIALFIIIGSNELIVVYVCALNFILMVLSVLGNRQNLWYVLPILVITGILSYFMIFADGNFARAELFKKPSFHILKTSFNALARGGFVLVFWIPTLLVMLLCIPGINRNSIELNFLPGRFSKLPALILIGIIVLIGVIFIGFFPSLYTTKWIPQRAYTPIFVTVTIVFSTFVVLILKRSHGLSKLNESISSSVKLSGIFLVILIMALSHNSNIMNAYVDLTSGKASSYHNQVITTYKQLQTTDRDTIYVNEIAKKPLILPIRWPENHNKLANNIWEEYFDVKHIELK